MIFFKSGAINPANMQKEGIRQECENQEAGITGWLVKVAFCLNLFSVAVINS
jgi:hypothetical protein